MSSWTFADPAVRMHSRLVSELAIDLERIRAGIGPSDEEIANAPCIEGWYLGGRIETALIGNVVDHPLLEGRAITSQLYVLDPELGYARTLSRWYRLGQEIC